MALAASQANTAEAAMPQKSGKRRQLRRSVARKLVGFLMDGVALSKLPKCHVPEPESQAFKAMANWARTNLRAVWDGKLLPLPTPSTHIKDLWPVLRLLSHAQKVQHPAARKCHPPPLACRLTTYTTDWPMDALLCKRT